MPPPAAPAPAPTRAAPDYSVARLLAAGLLFHLVFIAAVFDCYFTSPVVHGMRAFAGPQAPARRLVLVVGDGLRADLLFTPGAFARVPGAPPDAELVVAPYLRSVAETRGAFGIAHTRVPTESRPGHVALIGGMYEDVSAVTKGWKTNPVDFDSVFNRSSATFSFGSPDILPMFARGATPGRVRTWCYDEAAEDFTKDATALDVWALDGLRALFANATRDAQLDAQLRAPGVVFFLHLLGLDTTGHAYRPHSKEYMHNIRVVDGIVRDTEALVKAFYGDEDTAFVFTADHGMSKIGNHGDGHPDNTRTPLLTWGAGLRGPRADPTGRTHDAYSAPWGLAHLARRDVAQADVAALMATLLGLEWPVNSVGVLPDVDARAGPGLLSTGEKWTAEAGVVNAKVLLEHFRVKHDIKRTHTLNYRPFVPLEGAHATQDSGEAAPGSAWLERIERLIHEGDHTAALAQTSELIKTTLAGLRYLETYDRFLIRTIVIVAYLGWMAHGLSLIVIPSSAATATPLSPEQVARFRIGTRGIALADLALAWALFAVQSAPWTLYVYVAFPIYFWQRTVERAYHPLGAALAARKIDLRTVGRVGAAGAGVVGSLLGMVVAYTHRSIWSAGFVLIGVVWPIFWPQTVRKGRPALWIMWTMACLLTAIFPLIDVDRDESLTFITLGAVSMIIVGHASVFLLNYPSRGPPSELLQAPLYFQLGLVLVAMAVTSSSAVSLRAKKGLPLLNQLAGWMVLAIASAYPFVQRRRSVDARARLLSLFLAFCPLFIILSISVEGLFYVAFSATLMVWIEVEAAMRPAPLSAAGGDAEESKQEKPAATTAVHLPTSEDVRTAMFFLFFVQVGFFGTGNVASISSFYLAPVYRLVPVFNPFLMASLLIFKIIAPYIVLSAAFATLNRRLRLPPFSIFLIALTLTDVMTVTFFFQVTDTGSWLEIGQSITFFCIASLLLVWSAGICAAGEFLIGPDLVVSPATRAAIKSG